jgi:CBS domain-containing protein
MEAKHLMTTDVVTITPETPVHEIASLLANQGISAVPVIAEDGRMVGFVTEADLVRRLARGRLMRSRAGSPPW